MEEVNIQCFLLFCAFQKEIWRVEYSRMSTEKPKKKIDVNAMAKRLFSTVLLWGIVAGVFFSRNVAAVVALVIVLAVLGAIEYLRITYEAPGKQRRIGAFCISIGYLLWLASDLLCINCGVEAVEVRTERLTSFTPEIVGLMATLFTAFFMSLRREIKGLDSINAVGTSLICYIYVPVLFGGFMMRLLFLPSGTEVAQPEISGVWLVLFVAIVTKFTDMGAYLTGTLFGRHKMVKHISPGKTWEGTIGSFAVAQAGAFGIWYLAGEQLAWMGDWWVIALLGVIISVAAIIGDLAESILKRSMEVKDSGDLLPGIGGILDLIDSICFSAPAAYLFLLFVSSL